MDETDVDDDDGLVESFESVQHLKSKSKSY